jgi:protein-S-isoprenylcysteine O-methyltransferase Ste14
VLYALIVISPFALLGALAWALYRMRRRREEQRLLVA